MSDFLMLMTIAACIGTVMTVNDMVRSKRYADLSSIAEDRWSCRKIAEALEIEIDQGEDAGTYVQYALREALKPKEPKP